MNLTSAPPPDPHDTYLTVKWQIDTHKVGQLPADTKSKNPIEKGKQAVNKVTDTAKKATGVQQWYSYHLLTTCSGAFAKDGKTKKDVQCKKPQLSHFSTEPIDGLKKGLKDGIAGDALGKGVKDVGRWLGFVAWLYLGSLLASAALMLLKIKSVLISPLGHRLVGVQLWISLVSAVRFSLPIPFPVCVWQGRLYSTGRTC